jgi:Kef-type K+ transport system membrane component KefB
MGFKEFFLPQFEYMLETLDTPLFSVLFILIVVWIVGLLFEFICLPAVLGELLAGLVIGPSILGIVEPSAEISFLAKLGMFFLMFYAGLETNPRKLLKSKKTALLIGGFGTLVPFMLGLTVVTMLGGTIVQGIFIGAAISGTSMVTKSRILEDLYILKTNLGHIIMASAMVDNIMSFVLLAVAIKSVTMGFSIVEAFITLIQASLFFLISLSIGYKVYPHIRGYMKQKTVSGFTFALIVGLFFAFIAEVMRIHFVIGAYLAGLMVTEEMTGSRELKKLMDRFRVITHGFLGPLFIVSVAFKVEFSVIGKHPLLFLGVLIAAFVGKMVGVGYGAVLSGMKRKDAFTMGLGMNGRGTVELILAIVGYELGILTVTHITMLVLVAFLTTVTVPFSLKMRLHKVSPDLLE